MPSELEEMRNYLEQKGVFEEGMSEEKIKDRYEIVRRGKEEILKDKNLVEKICNELHKEIVGEDDTIKTLVLCVSGRLVENCNTTSYNLLVNSESGAGKDHAVRGVLRLFRKNIDYISKTRISPTVLNYFHVNEPDWTWDGKVFYNEDTSSSILNSDVFKVMCSTGSDATIVDKGKAKDLEVNGKPVMIITSASASPSPELIRRFVIINLDESIEQTKEILKRQSERAKTGETNQYDENLMKALTWLKRKKVRIKFADKLDGFFPSNNIIIRTHYARFLDYIKASCVLHQFQRETDEEGYLVATGQDYDLARTVLIKTTSNKFMIPLTKDQRNILEEMMVLEVVDKSVEGISKKYSVSDLEAPLSSLGISERWLREQLNKLVQYNLLTMTKEKRTEESAKPVNVYSLNQKVGYKIQIPTWTEITQITSITSNPSNTSIASNTSNGQVNYNSNGRNGSKGTEVLPSEQIEVEEFIPKL
jgi:hypothetical protein